MDRIESYLGNEFTSCGGDLMRAGGDKLEAICRGLFNKLNLGQPVCGEIFTPSYRPLTGKILQWRPLTMEYSPPNKVNCKKTSVQTKFQTGYRDKPYVASDVLAVMDICVTPCMHEKTKSAHCCMVPENAAHLFACCREMNCCPDQQPNGRRHRRAQDALGSDARSAHAGVSVSVTVAVEENNAADTVYNALLRCLQNPAKLDAMCLTGSSGQ